MIFISGITSKEKDLDYSEMLICPSCGSYGRINIFMTYNALSLFFIPIFKWSKKYYGRMSCCSSVFKLDQEIGRDIEAKRPVRIGEEDLEPMEEFGGYTRCRTCGSPVDSSFKFCPRCGGSL